MAAMEVLVEFKDMFSDVCCDLWAGAVSGYYISET